MSILLKQMSLILYCPGIDPSLDSIYLKNFDALFKKYNQAILESIGDTNPLLSEQIRNLNTEAIVQELNTTKPTN